MRNDGVIVQVGGRTRQFRFSANAFCDLEDATGKGMFEILETLDNAPSLKFVRAAVWACLRQSEPEITPAEAGDVIDELGLIATVGKLVEAVIAAFPDQRKAGESAEGNASRAAAGSGMSS